MKLKWRMSSANFGLRREGDFQPDAVGLGLDDGILHLGRQKHCIAFTERDRFFDSIDSDSRIPFQHHPDHRLVVGNRLFNSFREAHLLQLEIGAGHQPRYRREQTGHVIAALGWLALGVEVDRVQRFIDVQFARAAGGGVDAVEIEKAEGWCRLGV